MYKKRQIIGIMVITLLSVLLHSVYEMFPNVITSIFFPVNESIWEHNKLILISYIIWTVVQLILYKDKKNTIFASLISCITCILLVNLIFTPIYLYILNTNDNFIVTITVYILSIIASFAFNNYLLESEYHQRKEIISAIAFILLIIVLAFLTYNPLELPIFYDYTKEVYGIPY